MFPATVSKRIKRGSWSCPKVLREKFLKAAGDVFGLCVKCSYSERSARVVDAQGFGVRPLVINVPGIDSMVFGATPTST